MDLPVTITGRSSTILMLLPRATSGSMSTMAAMAAVAASATPAALGMVVVV